MVSYQLERYDMHCIGVLQPDYVHLSATTLPGMKNEDYDKLCIKPYLQGNHHVSFEIRIASLMTGKAKSGLILF